jgi:catalase
MAQTDPIPRQLVDALHTIFGDNHTRAVHAKGVLLAGRFTPSAEARELCKAVLFAGPAVPVTARFSNSTGIPTIPDTIPEASPRGLALKFEVARQPAVEIVAHAFDGFPAKTAAEFREFLLALAASGPQAAKPTAIERFLGSHPRAQAFLAGQKGPPESYATLSYFGVNAFRFTNARGASQLVRYRFVPRAGERLLDTAALAKKGPNYLAEELAPRLAAGPIELDWLAQLAEPGDPIDDPSIPWPATRRLVGLGAIQLLTLAADQAKANRESSFSPGFLEDGNAAADPMIDVRHAAYRVSVEHRR